MLSKQHWTYPFLTRPFLALYVNQTTILVYLQIAAKVLLDESLKCVEQEMTSLDEEERIDRPPKKIETTE